MILFKHLCSFGNLNHDNTLAPLLHRPPCFCFAFYLLWVKLFLSSSPHHECCSSNCFRDFLTPFSSRVPHERSILYLAKRWGWANQSQVSIWVFGDNILIQINSHSSSFSLHLLKYGFCYGFGIFPFTVSFRQYWWGHCLLWIALW